MTDLELNTLVSAYFQDLNNKLNANTKHLDIMPGGIYHVPTITSLGNFTRAPNGVGAYNLDTPVCHIKDISKTDDDRNIILIRRIVGYSAISRMASDTSFNTVQNALGILTTEMILTLQNAVGFKHTVPNAGKFYGTFARPGPDEVYFRSMEHSAGYELRLYSDTWPCISMPYLAQL